MNSHERRELVRDSRECTLQPGEYAVRRGERSNHMFLVIWDEVEVRPEGRPAVTLAAPAWFAEIALLRGEPRTADVVGAPSGARLLRMSRVSVLPALERNPRMASELSKVSDARREAAGVVDTTPTRSTLWQRFGRTIRELVGELRPW